MFTVGQKVTRVNSKPWLICADRPDLPHDVSLPLFGQVYVVAKVVTWGGREWLALVGFHEGYLSDDFRPVVEQKLPECLTRLLDAPITEPIGG